MNCPKCGAEQEQDRQECARCGIIFARWRESQEQAILRRQTGSYAAPPAEEQRTVPRWLAVVVAVVFVLLGILWTSHRQAVRAKRNLAAEGNALINEITPVVNKARQRQAEEAERLRRMQYTLERAEAGRQEAKPRAFSLDEASAMRLVNQCRETTIRETIHIPKSLDEYTLEKSEIYPMFRTAEGNQFLFVDRKDGRVTVRLGYSADVSGVSDLEDRIDIDLGGRKVTEVTEMTGSADHVAAQMYCGFENKVACQRLGIKEKAARAAFILQDGVWKVQWAIIPQGPDEPVHLCG